MSTHDVKIDLTEHGANGTVTVDGTPVAVRGIELEAINDRPVRVTLDLTVHDVSAQGEGLEVLIPESTTSTLRALGWTPPAADEKRAPSWSDFEQLVGDVHRTTIWPEPHVSRLIAEAGRARAEADRLRAARDAQSERIEAALEIHRPVMLRGIWVCNDCTPLNVLAPTAADRGRRGVEHPCATRRALEGAQDGDRDA
jgi:hypothetical protein